MDTDMNDNRCLSVSIGGYFHFVSVVNKLARMLHERFI